MSMVSQFPLLYRDGRQSGVFHAAQELAVSRVRLHPAALLLATLYTLHCSQYAVNVNMLLT